VRAAIDARALGSGRGGDESYTRGLLAGLAESRGADDAFPLLVSSESVVPKPLAGDPAFPVHVVGAGSQLRRYVISLPLALRRLPVDLLHSLIYAPLWSPVPIALMVTDLSFRHHPELYRRSTRLRLGLVMGRQLRRARVIMTLSEFCKRDICEQYAVPPERVFVVPCAIPPPAAFADDPALLPGAGVRSPFFLHVGNRHPRKNLPRLIRAFARAKRSAPVLEGHQLVIAGRRWWRVRDELAAAAEAPAGSVVFLDQVADRMRDALLRSAEALLYPSLFEGFGLPPLEAMAVGTPTIVSNAAAIPETVADASLLVDPLDVDGFARAMVSVATTAGLRDDLRERGLRRVQVFTARRMGERALAAFRGATAAERRV